MRGRLPEGSESSSDYLVENLSLCSRSRKKGQTSLGNLDETPLNKSIVVGREISLHISHKLCTPACTFQRWSSLHVAIKA